MLRIRHLLPLTVLAALLGFAAPGNAQTIIDEWSSVKAPPAPELKPVTVDPKTTALLVLDLVKQSCNNERRPRCVASIPRIEKLLAAARAKGVMLIYTIYSQASIADILPTVAPKGNEPVVVSLPDKFQNPDLEKMLKDKGITTIITIGTAANSAVLYTASAAAMRGFNVIVPVDGMSGDNTYIEQYVAYSLTVASGVSPKTTLTRIDMIKF